MTLPFGVETRDAFPFCIEGLPAHAPCGSRERIPAGRASRAFVTGRALGFAALWTLAALVPAPQLFADASSSPENVEESSPSDPLDRPIEGEEIVVTANHLETPANEVGSSITVLDREHIERRHARSVLELLRSVPGLEVVQGGGPGKVASLFLRGASAAQTLVLLDGVPVNGAASGLADLADLSPLDVERVEVLRGPQSGLFGSEAMGGVVSILTRSDAERFDASAELEIGSLALERSAMRVSGSSEHLQWRLAAEETSLDGVSSASETAGNDEVDPWRGRTASARLSWDLPRGGQLDATLRHADGDTDIDGFGFSEGTFVPVDDPNASQHRDATWASLQVRQPLSQSVTGTFRLAWADERLEGRDPDTFFNAFRLDSSILEAGARIDLDLEDRGDLSFGLESEDRVADNIGFFDEEVRLSSAFVQHRWSKAERLFVTTALRHDDHSSFGGETTGRLTVSQLLTRRSDLGLRLHGSWGTGFRAPSFYDLFFPFGSNPDLEPETSEGGDLGLEVQLAAGRAHLDLTLFQNDFENLIVLDGFFVPQNLGRARASGWEVLARAEPHDDLALALGWTRTDSEDRATGLALPRRPKDRWSLDVTWNPRESLRATLAAWSAIDRVDTGGAPMDDLTRIDFILESRAFGRWTPWIRVDNLLDDEAPEVPGFTTPGRLVAGGLRWSASGT